MSKPWGRLRKFLWPSQKIWTLQTLFEQNLTRTKIILIAYIFWLNSDTNYFGKIKQNIWISRTSYLSILTKNFQFVPAIYTFNSGFYKHCTALQIKYICMCGLNFKKFYSPVWSSRLQPLLLNSLFYSGGTEELRGC